MYLGVDLGTSGITVIVMNSCGDVVASESQSLTVSRPHPMWSEQDPHQWWRAFETAMDKLALGGKLTNIKAIGLSGQMHGATLLDKKGAVIRPAILWNDGRCEAQCKAIEQNVKNSRSITGNIMMPGFTAPKLRWVQENEPENFAAIDKVLLPKDYLRYRLSGEFASDMSDSSGTLWMDTQARDWSPILLASCGLAVENMPKLFEGNEITGTLSTSLAQKWQMQTASIVAGGGDNAAGAIGVGLTEPGQGMLSLGTSGVYFVVSDTYTAIPEKAVHSFCHALPNRWHLMSVLLSAASCVQWFAEQIVGQDVGELMQSLEQDIESPEHAPYFLPYLSGERTPHNNPHATGAFLGLTHSHTTKDMLYAVLEGVSFAFADGVDALHASGTQANEISVIGGGAKNRVWRQMLSDVLNKTIIFREGGDVGPALGAARLAYLADSPDIPLEQICRVPDAVETHQPDVKNHARYLKRRILFQAFYPAINTAFNSSTKEL